MDFFTSLLKAYEKAEEIGLVDQQTGENDPVLLPIYHDNKIIKNNDFYIEILFDKEGNFYKSRKIDVGENVIFPVTYESSNRTSTKIAPHPIVDSWYYVMSSNLRKEKQKKYSENLDYWISQTENENVKQFLQIIRDFVEKPKSVDLVLTSTFGTDYQLEDEYIDKNGKIPQVTITTSGMNPEPLSGNASYPAVYCCNLTNGHMGALSSLGRTNKEIDFPYMTCEAGERFITNIKDRNRIGYKYINLKETKKIEVIYQTDTDGELEIYTELGKESKGIIKLAPSTWWKAAETNVSFEHDRVLYLVYRGQGSLSLITLNLKN